MDSSSGLLRYKKIRKLGKGGFAKVYLVEEEDTLAQYAMKVFKLDSTRNNAEIVREIGILKLLQHPHIVRYKDVIKFGEHPSIVMEFCPQGDLKSYLMARGQALLPEKQIWIWFTQLASALAYLELKKIVHRDMKPQNVLISNNTLLLSDFGLSSVMKMSSTSASTTNADGTFQYMAPELFATRPRFGFKSDMWGLGCILFEMATLKPPFHTGSYIATMQMILNNQPAPVPDTFSNHLRSLIQLLLSKKSNERPSASEVLQHEKVNENLQDCVRLLLAGSESEAVSCETFLTPSLTGTYPLVDWNKLKSNSSCVPLLEWAKMLATEKQEVPPQLLWPPLQLPQDMCPDMVFIGLRRVGQELLLFGHLHPDALEDTAPVPMKIQVALQFVLHDNRRVHRVQREAVVFLKRRKQKDEMASYDLLSFTEIPWEELTTAPRGSLSINPVRPNDRYSYAGLSPLSTGWLSAGEFAPINWSGLPGTFCWSLEWEKIVGGQQYGQLDFPPLILPTSPPQPLCLFANRFNEELVIWGAFHPAVPQNTAPVPVTIRIALQLTFADKSVSRRVQTRAVEVSCKNNDDRPALIMTFSDLQWSLLAEKELPVATVSLTKVKPMDTFTVFGLVPLTSSRIGVFPPVDWNPLKARLDYATQWSNMLTKCENNRLHFPPLHLNTTTPAKGKIVIILVAVRDYELLDLHGTFHPEMNAEIGQIQANLKVKFHLKLKDGKDHFVEKQELVTISHFQNEDQLPWLFSFIFPWSKLTSSDLPIAEVTLKLAN